LKARREPAVRDDVEVLEDAPTMETSEKAALAARIADEHKADNIAVLDVTGICNFTDCFVVLSCASSLQLRGIAHRIERGLREHGVRTISSSGYNTSGWIVLDYGDVVIHLFHPETRGYYRLESLWADAKKVKWNR
jgi:ribosome-associated protein